MAIRLSSAFVNKMAQGFGLRDLLRDARIYVYSGLQPATANTAPTGTQLVVFTKDGGAYTPPVKSKAKITLSGASGTIDTIKVGGMAYNLLSAAVAVDSGALGVSADAIAANINARENPLNIIATSDSVDTVTLHAPYWLGALADGLAVATTQTTSTVTINGGSSATFGGTGSPGAGTTALNGLNFDFPAATGVISKPVGENWKGLGLNAGQAGWFRIVAGGSAVTGSADDIVMDGNISTSGGDINAGSLTIVVGAEQVFGSLTLQLPQTE